MASTCPNYSLPLYASLKSQYGEGGANLAANLFDSPAFQQWKGDGELPRMEGSQVFNNQGEAFDLTPLLDSRLQHLERELEVEGQTFSPQKAQAIVEAFNEGLSGKNFYAHQQDGEVVLDYKKPVLAPNGKKSLLFDQLLNLTGSYDHALAFHYQTTSPAFKQWFGASKVVDENGEPQLVWHGSTEHFEAFDTSKLGKRTYAPDTQGFYFTNNKEAAREYLHRWGGNLNLDSYLTNTYGVKSEKGNIQVNTPGLMEKVLGELPVKQTREEEAQIFGVYTSEEGEDFLDVDPYPESETGYLTKGGTWFTLPHPQDPRALLVGPENEKVRLLQAMAIRQLTLSNSYDENAGVYLDKDTSLTDKPFEGYFLRPLFLRMETPLEFNEGGKLVSFGKSVERNKQAQGEGRDGVITTNTVDPLPQDNYMVFNPNQVKSVFNNGKFSTMDSRIAFSALPSEDVQDSGVFSASEQAGEVNTLSPTGLGFREKMDDLRVLLQETINRARKVVGTAKTVEKLERLQAILNPAIEEATSLNTYLDSFHQDAFGGDGKKGYVEALRDLSTAISTELGKPVTERDDAFLRGAYSKLTAYSQYAADLDKLEDLQHLNWPDWNPGQLVEEGSPLWKLRELAQARKDIDYFRKGVTRQLLANSLSPYLSKKAQVAAKEFLTSRDKFLERAKEAELAGNLKGKTQNEANAKKAEEKFTKAYQDEATLLKELEQVTDDISLVGKLLEAGSGSHNSVLSTFHLYLNEVFDKARALLRPLAQVAHTEFQDFVQATGRGKLNSEKLFEGLYEEVRKWDKGTGQWVSELRFVQELDYSKFNAAKARVQDKANDISDDPTDPQRMAVMAKFYKDHTEELSEEERATIIKEKNRLLDEGEWTEQDFTEWNERSAKLNPFTGKVEYFGEFRRPKASLYTNPKYTALLANAPLKRMYDYLLGVHEKSQAAYPAYLRDKYLVPRVKRSTSEKAVEGGLKVGNPSEWWSTLQDTFQVDRSQDALRYGSMDKTIPVLYNSPLVASEVSRDLLTSVLLEAQAAADYKARQEALPLAQTLEDTVQQAQVVQKDSQGRAILNKAAKQVGLSKVLTDQGEEKGGNLAQAITNSIDSLLFGETRKKQEIGGISVDKVLDVAMAGASQASVISPLNLFKHVANYLNAQTSVLLEVWGGKHLTSKQWAKGGMYVNSWLAGEGKVDILNSHPTSLFGQLMERLDVVPGKESQEFGRSLTKSTGGKLLGQFWGGLLGLGEVSAQGQMFAGIALQYEVEGKDGKISNLLDIFEKDDSGTIQVKPNFVDSFGEQQEQALRSKLRALSKSLHGNYSQMSKPEASRYAAGRVVLMFKKFLQPAVQRRFGQTRTNQELGEVEQGYYNTFFKQIFGNKGGNLPLVLQALNPLDKSESPLTPLEVSNLKSAARELMVVGFMGLALVALKGIGEDDDELRKSRLYQASLFELQKMKSELQFFIPLGGTSDQMRIFSSPTALTTTLAKAGVLTNQLLPWNIQDTYSQNSRFHKKGDWKVQAALSSLLGVKSLSPEQLNTQFERTF